MIKILNYLALCLTWLLPPLAKADGTAPDFSTLETYPSEDPREIPLASFQNLGLRNLTAHELLHLLASGPDGSTHLKLIKKNGQGLALSQGYRESISFEVKGVPLCEYQVSLVRLQGSPFALGSLPHPFYNEPPATWPELSSSETLLRQALESRGVFVEDPTFQSEKCYVVREGTLFSAWKIHMQNLGLTYEGIADGEEIYHVQPLFFHATGNARIYPNNALDASLQDFELTDLKESGQLSNNYFFTEIQSTSQPLANKSDFQFVFSPESSEFAETSIFTNANRILAYFQSIGYQNFGNFPLKLVVHATIGNDSNNALYQPAVNTHSTIYIGDGDGTILKNLATDRDVVSHEFGHHVIFGTLTSVKGASLVLHEGLADFFTFAKTGNACLGESICPSGSPIRCAVEAQCLRTAENSYSFTSADLPSEAHLRSQFISGLLWDLTAKDAIDRTLVSKAVLGGVALLAQSSGYRDFIIALLKADESQNGGAHCQTILERAQTRGLESFLTDVSCSNTLPEISGTQQATTIAEDNSESSNSGDSGGGLCGVAGGSVGTASGLWWLLLPLMMMILWQLPRPERAKVRIHRLKKQRTSPPSHTKN